MDVVPISIDRAKARELYRNYKKHMHYSLPMDREVMRAYQLLAQGKLVIKALDSIRAAGLNDEGLPKLAIVRATAKECHFRGDQVGGGIFGASRNDILMWRSRNRISVPSDTFPRLGQGALRKAGVAQVPSIPIHLRPRRGLDNYHILWEADWHEVPYDPYLLRRIGKGDMWLVVAMWDLTEVERAALSARI